MARPAPHGKPAPWGWALAGAVAGALLTLVLFLPAEWLARALARASGNQFLLVDTRGTVWNGSARVVLTGGTGSAESVVLPGRVDWRLRPAGAGVRATLASDCCMPQPAGVLARWRPGGVAIEIADATSRWPAGLLAGLGTPWNTLQLEGDLTLATRGLSVEWVRGRLAVAGQAELVAQRMSSRLSTLRPMGSYRITLQGGSPPTVRLDTLEGSLRLAGSGQWVGSRLRFTGEASAEPEREAALSNLLNIVGRRSGGRSIITIG